MEDIKGYLLRSTRDSTLILKSLVHSSRFLTIFETSLLEYVFVDLDTYEDCCFDNYLYWLVWSESLFFFPLVVSKSLSVTGKCIKAVLLNPFSCMLAINFLHSIFFEISIHLIIELCGIHVTFSLLYSLLYVVVNWCFIVIFNMKNTSASSWIEYWLCAA